jgi:penicillin-binding protein-related factor A (putative recombinase)
MPSLNPTEHQIQSAILNYFQMLRDCFVWRNQSGASNITNKYGKSHFVRFGLKGSADIIGCYRGHFIAIEVKRQKPKGKTTPEQDRFLQNIRDCGGYAIVAYSVDDAQTLIARINKEHPIT